jgi:hypothetical protein
MSVDQHWATRYLDIEADRIAVYDMLDDIENGITILPLSATPHLAEPPRSPVLLATVAAVAMLLVGAALLNERSTPARVAGSETAARPSPTDITPSSIPRPATAPTTEAAAGASIVAATKTTLPHDLPDGGLWLAGQVPSCTALSEYVYRCTLNGPLDPNYPDSIFQVDMTEIYVDSSSLVAGGCRATTDTGRDWLCYVGKRAVNEGLVATYGEAKLGDWQPNTYAAG